MHTLWYWIVSLMLVAYVVLDGYDIGAGILHLIVARTDQERRLVLAAIGPYWSGNEVFLIAAGGLLLFAFPRVYAVGLSGFYLPVMMLLWLLVFRGIAIEFRGKQDNRLWKTFWDTAFCAASLLLSIVLGTAFGNLVRGVPVGADQYFDGALWTNFSPFGKPGLIDWYTLSVGLFAALVLAAHGALWVGWKTGGAVSDRCYQTAKVVWPVAAVVTAGVTVMTAFVRAALYQSLLSRPWSYCLAVAIIGSLAVLLVAVYKRFELLALLASSSFVASLLVATAAAMYPNMLVSTVNAAYSITAITGSTGESSLSMGLGWWIPTMLLTAVYFVYSFKVFYGKVQAGFDAH